jgi:hypothetical protein
MDLSERGVLEPLREQGLLAEDFHAGKGVIPLAT